MYVIGLATIAAVVPPGDRLTRAECAMLQVCSLRPAFHAFNTQTLISKIRSARAPLVPKKYSQPLRELLRSMLFQDEARRPTAADILVSPCLQVLPLSPRVNEIWICLAIVLRGHGNSG